MKKLITFLIIAFSINAFGQTSFKKVAPNSYLINFKDKKNNQYSIEHPRKFLTNKALKRRQKYNIKVTEQDLPITQAYLDSLKNLGLEISTTSKWLNCAVVHTLDSTILLKVEKLPFVKLSDNDTTPKPEKITIPLLFDKKKIKIKRENKTVFGYGSGESQIGMLNGHYLHNKGFQGQGVLIAVLDAGFYHANELPAFDSIFANDQIVGVRDCVKKDGEVFSDGTHGMMVLSTMAANWENELVGTSPKAKYLLVRTEDGNSENLIEEYYWANGAEYADSLGADIVTSSLGYVHFDDKEKSHKYEELDGDSTPISIASDIATDKGMLLVTSAGNEGDEPWRHISAPADADKILTVGSVTSRGKISNFSSRGPTADGRIKPDVMAQGSFAYVQGTNGNITFSFGTSFSGPIMAGMVACLWQAFPEFTPREIISVIRLSSSQFDTPNNDYGYGIPDFAYAYEFLKSLREEKEKQNNQN